MPRQPPHCSMWMPFLSTVVITFWHLGQITSDRLRSFPPSVEYALTERACSCPFHRTYPPTPTHRAPSHRPIHPYSPRRPVSLTTALRTGRDAPVTATTSSTTIAEYPARVNQSGRNLWSNSLAINPATPSPTAV